MGAPPARHGPPQPEMPPAPSDDQVSSEPEVVPPGYAYMDTLLPSAQFVNFDLYAKDRMGDNHGIPNLPTDTGISTGYNTISGVVMQLRAILKTIATM